MRGVFVFSLIHSLSPVIDVLFIVGSLQRLVLESSSNGFRRQRFNAGAAATVLVPNVDVVFRRRLRRLVVVLVVPAFRGRRFERQSASAWPHKTGFFPPRRPRRRQRARRRRRRRRRPERRRAQGFQRVELLRRDVRRHRCLRPAEQRSGEKHRRKCLCGLLTVVFSIFLLRTTREHLVLLLYALSLSF